MNTSSQWTLVCLVALGLSSCSETDADSTFVAAPNYGLGTNAFTSEGANPFVAFADDLSEERRLTLDDALEVNGGLFSSPLLGGLFFTQEEGGVLQRWRFLEDGSLEPDGRISFAGLGLSAPFLRPSHVQFVARDKAYLLDNAFGGIVVWNPRTLEIIRNIEIPEVGPAEGEFGEFSLSVVRRNDELVFTYHYSSADGDSVFRRADLVVLDVTTDEVQVDTTTACGDLRFGLVVTSGDIVWASSTRAAGIHRVIPQNSFEPCMVTVPQGTARFEEGAASLLALTDGAPAGALIPAGEDRALLSVFDEDRFPIPDDAADTSVIFGPLAWRWWEVDLSDMTANLLPESEYFSSGTISYEIGEDVYVISLSEDFASSTLALVQPEGVPVSGLSVVGVLNNGLVALRDQATM